MKLSELKIIVTGAASGMGAHFARQLSAAGAAVTAGDVNEGLLSELPQQIFRRRLDVSDPHHCEAFVAWAAEEMGGLNALVNCAGIIRDGLLVKKDRETGAIKKLSKQDWKIVLDVNLSGATFMAQEVVAHMVEKNVKPGVVVNISSISRHGNRGQSNYVAAKAALAANTLTWAREWAAFGIRCAAIAPGMIETPMTRGMNQKARDAVVAMIPSGRIGEPEDIWRAVKFAIECDYFNARTMDVDGGLSF
ncbi:MAG: SDR family oxidoreductase [Polyangiaceae bacterium]